MPLLLQLAQILHERQAVPNLFVVTNGAAGVGGDQQLDLSQAILHGMARVIRNECPQIPLNVIDLIPPRSCRWKSILYFTSCYTVVWIRMNQKSPCAEISGTSASWLLSIVRPRSSLRRERSAWCRWRLLR